MTDSKSNRGKFCVNVLLFHCDRKVIHAFRRVAPALTHHRAQFGRFGLRGLPSAPHDNLTFFLAVVVGARIRVRRGLPGAGLPRER